MVSLLVKNEEIFCSRTKVLYYEFMIQRKHLIDKVVPKSRTDF